MKLHLKDWKFKKILISSHILKIFSIEKGHSAQTFELNKSLYPYKHFHGRHLENKKISNSTIHLRAQ